jgi:DNA-binding MarR family transcriptional regulator
VSDARLTQKGRIATERVLSAASRCYQQAFEKFSGEEVVTLIALLSRVHLSLRGQV